MRRCALLVAARRWTLLLVAALGAAAERCDEASYRNGIDSCSPCDPNGNCTGLDFSPRSNATQQLDLGVFLPLATADGAPLWGTTRLWPLAATAAVAADMFARGDGRVVPAFANRCDGVAVSLTYHNRRIYVFFFRAGGERRGRLGWESAGCFVDDGILESRFEETVALGREPIIKFGWKCCFRS